MFSGLRRSKFESEFLVYQMGKVGSSSISLTIRESGAKLIHTHSHIEAKKMIDSTSNPINIICGVREPLARNISAFFENMDNENNRWWYLAERSELESLPINELCNSFLAKHEWHTQQVVRPWFSRFQNVTGVRLDKIQRRKNIFFARNKNLKIHFYKLENFGYFKDDFLKKFGPELKISTLKSSNIADKKWYGPIYEEFKNNLKIDAKNYRAIYSDIDYVNSLYTQQEISKLTRRYIT